MNKVVVIGGGAMGAIFAVGLAQVGRDVTVLDTATELVERINAEGIAISSGGELVVTKVPATTDPSCLSTTDLAIVFVKAHHTPSVAQALGGHLSSDAIVHLPRLSSRPQQRPMSVPRSGTSSSSMRRRSPSPPLQVSGRLRCWKLRMWLCS
jgi:predicted dinucleotide-binding enzyme